jgi:hypothetical protein
VAEADCYKSGEAILQHNGDKKIAKNQPVKDLRVEILR